MAIDLAKDGRSIAIYSTVLIACPLESGAKYAPLPRNGHAF